MISSYEQLANLVKNDEVRIIAESGIKSPIDVTNYCQSADAVIVGSALLVDDDIKKNLGRFSTVLDRDQVY